MDDHVKSREQLLEELRELREENARLRQRLAGSRPGVHGCRAELIVEAGDTALDIETEFQYLSRWIVSDHNGEVENLCYSHMGAPKSKVSSQIVAGSSIGWRGANLRHMVNCHSR